MPLPSIKSATRAEPILHRHGNAENRLQDAFLSGDAQLPDRFREVAVYDQVFGPNVVGTAELIRLAVRVQQVGSTARLSLKLKSAAARYGA